MALTPFREIAVHFLQVREHRSSFTRNHLPKHASFQAARWRSYEVAARTLPSSEARAISLPMPTWIRNFKAAPTAPFTNPVERVAARFAARADHSRSYPALPPAHGRHGPFPQGDLNLDARRRDHDPIDGGPGDRR